ncbi:MAG: hypothetical protein PHN69_02815 [Candidatus Pacebacteria bacterium]|nr:hypothetical protein [Candidatus Paceibacterota bacterium]
MAASSGEDWKSFIDRMCKLETENAELLQKVQQLEQVGDRIVKLVNEVYAMAGGPCMLQDAVKEWEKTKEE